MRHFIIPILTAILFSFSANAQELKRTEPDMSDYIPLLNAAGYEVYTFDISSLRDETYNIEFSVREYVDGALVENEPEGGPFHFILRNRRMLSDFPEEYHQEILAEGPVYDLEKGILTLGEKVSVGFSPAADSLKMVTMMVENLGALRKGLSMKPLNTASEKKEYSYDYRPFKVGALQLGDFTPLVMFGSYWYDEEEQVFRFCGESELEPDLSSKMLASIPHYYVLGMIVTKR